MWKKFVDLLSPFTVIARELTKIASLYEADLAARTPSIVLVTEKPGKSDTEVTYMGEEPKKSLKERMAELLPGGEGEEE